MNNNGIITLSSVPTDIENARLLQAKIASGQVTLHPDHPEKILTKLERVINGTYQEPEFMETEESDFEFLNEFNERRRKAIEREENRNSVREPIQTALLSLQSAEEALISSCAKYEYQYELTKSKLCLLKILQSLEAESNEIFERNLIG